MLETRNIREINPDTIQEPHQRKALLAMQATALYGSDGFERVNEGLYEAVRETGAAPTMTYEDLVFVNPLNDGSFVLSESPEVAKHEDLFYRSHNVIEVTLGQTIDSLRLGEFEVALAGLQLASKQFGRLYRNLEPSAFAKFRPYFRGINGFPGPSGLFTAAIPTIDLLTHGGVNISEEERDRLIGDIDRGLYPSHQAGLLKDLLVSEKPEVEMPEEVGVSIAALLNRFRKVHTGSVRRFVPQALDAGAEGSGGIEDVAGYLSSKMLKLERSMK